MEVRLADAELRRVTADPSYRCTKWPEGIIKAFWEAYLLMKAAKDDRDLYVIGGYQFEKLKGDRKEQRSIRLNKQWRLIVTIKTEEGGGRVVVVHGIEDYHS